MTDDVEVVAPGGRAMEIVRRPIADAVLVPVQDVKAAMSRLDELARFCGEYLTESADGGNDGGDYGVIPGAGKKKTLLKSGSDKLCDVYGLADRYVILSKVEDFDRGLFDYNIECRLFRKTDEMFVGSGLGSASSYESKYRYRKGQRACPKCHKDGTIIKGKEQYGGGWVCYGKLGGCGEKFKDNDATIVDQPVGRVTNPDMADTKNTILKMAKKRAKIDAVIGVTRSSGIFTQDLDELVDHDEAVPPVTAGGKSTVQEPAKPAAKQDQVDAGPPETQAQKIARVKAEHAAKASTAPAPAPAPKSAGAGAEEAAPETETPAATPTLVPVGHVFVTAINVRNGPMVLKDGVTKPSWGPLFVVAFSGKVKADDNVMVKDATTFDTKIASAAEDARDQKRPVKPEVVAGKKKGNYELKGL